MEAGEGEGLAGVERGAEDEGLAGVTATPLPLWTVVQPRSMLQALKGKTRRKFWHILR